MLKGTINNLFHVVIKDKVKQILFLLGYKSEKKKSFLTARTIDEKFALANSIVGVHQSKFEILNFIDLVEEKKVIPKIICEIGTANGGTSLLLASVFNSVTDVICIDLYVKNKKKLVHFLKPKKVFFFEGSSYDEKTLEQVQKKLNGNKIDVLFIDGDHRYEGVKSDYHLYKPLMNQNGIIAFHDIIEDFKTKHNNDTGKWSGDVPKFWNEIKLNHSVTKEIFENKNQDGMGIGVIVEL